MLQPMLAENALKRCLASEMQQKSDLQIRRAETTEELKLSHRVSMFRRLVLDDDFLVDHHVHRLSRKRLASIVHHHRDFTVYAMAFCHEIPLEGEGIDVCLIPKAELSVYVSK